MVEDVEDEILDDVRLLKAQYPQEPLVLAGASVHFDRGFIRAHMPRLNTELSHRHFDVSTLRMLFDELGYESLGQRDYPTEHRAFYDALDSYLLYRRYADKVNSLSDLEKKNFWERLFKWQA
jgi:oligoribonuclease (3'-5' exoribonuclease)